MKKIKYSIILLVILATSCNKVNDFLDEAPSRTAALQITSVEHLEQLLNSFNTFNSESNRSALYSTGDWYVARNLYGSRPVTFSLANIQYALRDVDFLASSATTTITDGNYWTGEFRKIFYARVVPDYLDKVPDVTPLQKASLKAEAHLIRAYSRGKHYSAGVALCAKQGLPKVGNSYPRPGNYCKQASHSTEYLLENNYPFRNILKNSF